MTLTSPAFADGQPIPAKFTCDGADVSPPHSWTDVPKGTKSFALVCNDPDAPMGTWVHWVLYGLPAATLDLPERIPPDDSLPNGSRQGVSDFRRIGYGGPCPLTGKAHRYQFNLYALDADIPLKPGATKQRLLTAMQGHVLAEASLTGTYQRRH